MVAFVLLIALLLLLLLNAFFVLAEFAAVKVRSTRIEELADQGNSKAKLFKHVQSHLDEYLSVCQVGITAASIGLGFVGEPAVARLVAPMFEMLGPGAAKFAPTVSITLAYLLVSFLHIVIGEQVPKYMAIRSPEASALFSARALHVFRFAFYMPLVVLNGSANAVLRLLRLPSKALQETHTEEELRIILARSQTGGLMSFRRLLLLENVFELGELRVRDVMRPRISVKILRANASWEQNFRTIIESRLSRMPLIDSNADKPVGIIHIKDLIYEGPEGMATTDLRMIARPYHTTTEDTLLENLLAELQRRRKHLALVVDREGKWSGLITMEDVLEEIVGNVEDEFETAPQIFLGDALTVSRVILGVNAPTVEDAIRETMDQVYDRAAQDIDNIVGLEHVNVTIDDQRLATLFYVAGLGFTRDPYLSVSDDNMWINFGRQQFHLPARGKPQVLRGHVGVVVPDLDALKKRFAAVREKLAETRFSCSESNGQVVAISPWGNEIRAYAPQPRFGDMQLGMPYVELNVPKGAAAGIARFYKQAFNVKATADKQAATVPVGRNQVLIFRETDAPLPAYDGHHIAVYIADFSGPHKFLKERNLITEESNPYQYRFTDIVDPDSGQKLYELEHEVRSITHPMYGRPFINRNPEQTQRGYVRGHDAFVGES